MYYSEITMTLDERTAYLQENRARFTIARHNEMMQRLQRDRNLASVHIRMVKEFIASHS